MPVTGATTRNDYTASAGQTVFNYTFQILLATDIKVIKNGTLLTINNDYTVADAGEQDGGTITLTTGASSGDAIAIFLGMPIDRTTQYQEAGDFLASDVNGDFDKAYVALNQVQTDVSRTLHLQDQDPSVNMELPLASERANKYLAFNAAGYPVATSDASTGTSSTLTFKDFGAVGDGVTDDTQALQDAFDYATANRAVLAPTKGVFLVNAPIVVGDFSGIKGYTSNNRDASCVIKAGSSFTSTYTMTYYDPEVGGGSTPLTYDIASILISKAWVDGAQVGNPIYIGKILLDGDSKKGSRGEPIHGLMMQAWASYVECNTANTTGYGIFFNLQKSNGDFAGNHVGNHFKANRIYKSGITPTGDSSPLSYTLNNQTHYYGAFQAGSLEFSRDSEGNQSRGKATDAWITDFVQASTCTGTAIRVINGGGWSGTGIHLNGPGRHGIYVDGCLSSGWTNNYIDGWGAHIDENEGNFYAFWFADIFGFEDDEANASLTCSDNRVRLRDIPNKTGNKLIGYGAKGTAASTARVIMNGNSYTARPDVTQDTVAISYPFNFSGIQQGGLNITLNGNDLDPDSYPQDTNLYLVNFGRYIQFSSQTGNSWQTVTAKPTRRGARGEIVYRKDAVDSEPTHYLNVSGIDHGYDWKAMGSSRSGTTAERPTLDSNDAGFQYFDTTLNDPIWWTGTAWDYQDVSGAGVSVKSFGAVGDGTTDDRAAIQAAIDYAEGLSISPQGTPVVTFPSGRYRIGSSGDTTGIVIKKANVLGSGPFGCTLVWGGDANGTCVQWEAKFRKSFGGFRFDSLDSNNDPKIWFDATYVSSSDIIPKLDWGDFFHDLFFTQTANVADACHMNLPKIINCYATRLRFQAAPHLIRIAQQTTASANRVFALQDWTTDFNQLADGGVKSLFKVDMQGAASLTLALSNARVETRERSMGSPKAIVEVHNSNQGAFTPGSQSFTSTAGQVDYVINTAPDDVEYGDQITITDDGVDVNRKDYSYDADTKTVTLATAPATGSAIVISWAPFEMPARGISVDLRDMGFQLTKDASPTDDSQVSQEAVLVHHTTDQTNVTSDIQLQNVFFDGFSSLYGGNWNSAYSTPDPSDLTGNVRIKFLSVGRVLEKESQQFGDYVKIGDAATFHREASNSMSLKGADGTDIDFAVTGTIAVDTCKWHCGSGTPEGVVTATVGSLFTRTDGGADTTLYVKESGTGNTGWVAK